METSQFKSPIKGCRYQKVLQTAVVTAGRGVVLSVADARGGELGEEDAGGGGGELGDSDAGGGADISDEGDAGSTRGCSPPV